MIIDNLNIVGTVFPPLKANPPLVIDPDAVLPLPIAYERFKPIAGQACQVAQAGRLVQQIKAPLRLRDERGEPARAPAFINCPRFLILE
jgi:hypothetical protein